MDNIDNFKPSTAFEGYVFAKIKFLCDEIKDIKQNHFPTIYKKLDTANRKPSWLVVTLITFLSMLSSGLIVGILVAIFKK